MSIPMNIGARVAWETNGKRHEGTVQAMWGDPLRVVVKLNEGELLILMAADLKGGTGIHVAKIDVPRAVLLSKAIMQGHEFRMPLNEALLELARAVLHLAEPQPAKGEEAA